MPASYCDIRRLQCPPETIRQMIVELVQLQQWDLVEETGNRFTCRIQSQRTEVHDIVTLVLYQNGALVMTSENTVQEFDAGRNMKRVDHFFELLTEKVHKVIKGQ